MIVDPESFRELSAHLGRISRGILRTAEHMETIAKERGSDDDEWGSLLDQMMAIVMEMIVVDKLVSALQDANSAEGQRPPTPLHRA